MDPRIRRLLLVCGIASSVVYVALDLVSSALAPGYHYTSQTVSELSAIGTPTQPLWIGGGILYGMLLVAFAAGVWVAAEGRRSLRAVALLLLGVEVVGIVWGFFPMHQRSDPKSFTDTMHVALAGVNGAVTVAAMICAAVALPGRFRLYSLITLAALFVGGYLTSLQAEHVGLDLPTPGIGLLERINVYGYLLWVAVLGVRLLRATPRSEPGPRQVRPRVAQAAETH